MNKIKGSIIYGAIMVIIYIINFVIIPKYHIVYYPLGDSVTLIALAVLCIGIVIGVCLTPHIICWIIPNLLHMLLIYFFHGQEYGFYGLGMIGIQIDGASPKSSIIVLIIELVILFLFIENVQFVVWGMLRLVKHLKKYFTKNNKH